MNLSVHLFIHLSLSLVAGVIAWRIYKKPLLSFLGAVAGGFFIDLDHLFDYIISYGFNFDLNIFLSGRHFLESNKIYVLFHGWEYILVMFIVVCFVKNISIKAFLLAIALASFIHLGTDVVVNEGATIKGYSIVYRIKSNFEVEKIVTPEHFIDHQQRRVEAGFERE